MKSNTFILAIVVAVLVAACQPATAPTGEAPAAGEPVELSFWSEWSAQPEIDVIAALVAEFNESHPNINVVHRPIENEQFFTALRTGFTSGEPPDVFQHEGHGNLTQFVVPGEVADISDWWAENGDRFQAGTEASINWSSAQC